MPLISFNIPCKHQKTSDFLMFSGGIERDQWYEMGHYKLLFQHPTQVPNAFIFERFLGKSNRV